MHVGARIERDLRGAIRDFQHDRRARAGRQFRETPCDGRQRRIVADQQMPVETGRDDERTARAADAEPLADACLRGPLRCRARMVQHEFQIEFAGGAVEAARREVARDRLRFACRKLGAVRAERRQRGAFRARRREKYLHVIVERRGFEIREIGAAERDAQQMRRHGMHAQHLQQAELEGVAHAGDGALGCVLHRSVLLGW
ncbi:hypothetical protein IST4110_04915 [Burkholderia cenocepacia]|nr:hypothetical protein IST4110_04915 [Burkholderia cenocepacia]